MTAILVTSAGFVSKAIGLDLYCSCYRLLTVCTVGAQGPLQSENLLLADGGSVLLQPGSQLLPPVKKARSEKLQILK